MFDRMERRKKREREKEHRKQAYDRVYELHERASFLCYINDVYQESYQGRVSVKLEGIVAKGTGRLVDTFLLFDCEGNKKAEVTMEEFYLGNQSVEQLEGGDKRVALYPNEQETAYLAGDILCLL